MLRLLVPCLLATVAIAVSWSGVQSQQVITQTATTVDESSPSDLSASVELSGVVLSWTAPTDDVESITGYEIYRKRLLEFETKWAQLVADTGTLDTTYTDATANVPDARYRYKVYALRGDEQSTDSTNAVSVTIPIPPKPRNLTAQTTDDGIQLTWSEGTVSWQTNALPLTGYEINRIEESSTDNPDPEWQLLVETSESDDSEEDSDGDESSESIATSYLDATGYQSKSYSYAIRAVHGFVKSHWEGIAGPVAGHLSDSAD